ncbi:GlcG/HbpS family heme-binding protein [Paraburkholderia sp. BCC1886]|uniref:GlcG/HbpS family heme-binding protein n=1 Tax=Paraburkholderia sp. BCC1886 TaxID=2562670 RepID=UPI0011838CA3|nr:heme-binding protein [Paraburkholderia sp. BCC1886]
MTLRNLRHLLLGVALAGVGASAFAAGSIVETPKLQWRLASQLAADAVSVCESRGYSVTATVVDTSGHQQAVVKGDTVPLQSLSVSYRKAYTAYSYGQAFDKSSTGELLKSGHGGPADAALNTIPEVMFVPGGVIIRAGKTVLGGLGVSGAPGGDKDEACAAEALSHFQEQIGR